MSKRIKLDDIVPGDVISGIVINDKLVSSCDYEISEIVYYGDSEEIILYLNEKTLDNVE